MPSCIADRLAMMKYQGWKWYGFDDFDEWITHRPWLREAMEKSLTHLQSLGL